MPKAGTIPIKSCPQILNENRTNVRDVRIGYRETYWRVWAIGRDQPRISNFCTLRHGLGRNSIQCLDSVNTR
jgi:hypothetical protein